MTNAGAPRVTVCVPLYRSARFVDRIIRNISSIDAPDVEVIVSDRHSEDGAIETIAERFSGDARVRTIRAADRLNWAEHYNRLLGEARGGYCMWMPHDDDFSADYVPRLTAALDADPDAVLAYGRILRVDLEGRPLVPPMSPAPLPMPEPWAPDAASGLLIRRETEEPFRGLFRRDVVLGTGLWIRPTVDAMSEDAYWVFALALRGRFRLVTGCTCRKAYYAASTHARWGPMRVRHIANGRDVLRSYVRAAPIDVRHAPRLNRAIDRWAAHAMAGVAARHLGVPSRLRRSAQRVLSRVISDRGSSS
jgi:GT2 family glycosyltransferase